MNKIIPIGEATKIRAATRLLRIKGCFAWLMYVSPYQSSGPSLHMAKVRRFWRNTGTWSLKTYEMARMTSIASISSHASRSHNSRNFPTDLRDSLEWICPIRDLHLGKLFSAAGAGMVLSDMVMLTGGVDSICRRGEEGGLIIISGKGHDQVAQGCTVQSGD